MAQLKGGTTISGYISLHAGNFNPLSYPEMKGSQGPQGFSGPQGRQGNPGPSIRGNQGPQGYQGNPGTSIRGNQGPQGPQGNVGVGITGYQGNQGNQGNVGVGITGYQGNQGNVGGSLTGYQGDIGDPGPSIRGNQGTQGRQGNGTQGSQGPRGNQGPQGRQGNIGLQGYQGTQGRQGNGTQGPQGFQGYQGNQGRQGDVGFTGPQGPKGRQGDASISTGLERITDGGTGWRMYNADLSKSGPLGSEAIDISHSQDINTTRGATSEFSFASGYRTNVGGTSNNTILNGNSSEILVGNNQVIIGGYYNRMETTGEINTITGGYINNAFGTHSVIASGKLNYEYGNYNFQSGYQNLTLSTSSTSAMIGGIYNIVKGKNNVILGGYGATSNDYCEIVGGRYNVLGTGSTTTWGAGDNLFTLGNGTSDITRVNIFKVTKLGTMAASADIFAYATSDERLKDNITLISDPIGKLKQLRGVTWDWNDNADEIQKTLPNVGLIAQDVEKVLPQLVQTRQNGNLALDYPKIVSLLVEVGKSQQEQIQKLLKLINKE